MKNKIIIALAIALILPTCVLGDSTVIQILEDAEVQSGQPDTNFGAITPLSIRVNPTTILERDYFLLNISEIADNQTIDEAILKLSDGGGSSSGGTFAIYHVYVDSWSEGTITWNNQPCGTSTTPTLGSNCSNSYMDALTQSNGASSDFYFNITDAVREEHNQTNDTISLVIQFTGYTTLTERNFDSSEFGGSEPEVNISYSPTPTTTTTTTTTIPTTTTTVATCENPKNCTIYDSNSAGDMMGGTFCGLYNLLICVTPPYMDFLFYSIIAILIVSAFGFIAYLLSVNS